MKNCYNQPMTDPSDDKILVATPQQMHQDMLRQVQDQLKTSTGETAEVEPVTADSSADVTHAEDTPGDSFNQFYERGFLARPGFEPSKTFLDKLLDRVRKKYPKAIIKLKEKK